MSDKKNICVLDIILCVISVFFLVGIFTVFHPCGPKDDGTWMACHNAGNVVKIFAALLVIFSAVQVFIKNKFAKITLSGISAVIAFISALIPTCIMKLCMMKTMRCHAVMKPAVVIFSILIIILCLVDIFMQAKKSKK